MLFAGEDKGNTMRFLTMVLAIVVQFSLCAPSWSADTVRLAVLKYGTVNWELDVIKHHGLDKQAGINLDILKLASSQATKVAILSGSTDIIVTDWMWVSRQRTTGADYVFSPYSTAVGAVMVPQNSKYKKLSDLEGKKIGIAGGPLDKSWLFLRAVASNRDGFDLKAKTEQVYGAPPLLAEKAKQGELDAVLNFWHYCARLEAKGFRRLIDIQEAAGELGAKGNISSIGYIFPEKWAKENDKAIKAFLSASRKAKQILATSDEEWERIRPLTKAADDKTLIALRDRYRAGIPNRSAAAEEADAKTLFKVLEKLGGKKLVGSGKELAPGTFWNAQ